MFSMNTSIVYTWVLRSPSTRNRSCECMQGAWIGRTNHGAEGGPESGVLLSPVIWATYWILPIGRILILLPGEIARPRFSLAGLRSDF